MAVSGDRLQQIISQYDTALAGIEDSTLERVNKALEASYKRLERELLAAYNKHSGNTSLLPNQRKLLILDQAKQLLSLVNPGNADRLQKDFERMIQDSTQQGGNMAADLVSAIANEKLKPFAGIPIEAVRFQAQEGLRRLSRHSDDFASRASAIVEQGLIQGWGARKVASYLRGELGVTKGKAEAIARTETIAAHSDAMQANFKRNGIEYFQFMATVGDERLCPLCSARNQQIYKVGESKPPIHPRCLPGDTLIVSTSVQAGTSREYTGEVVCLETASGKKLTATPNHPVLTDKGWIAIDLIQEGFHVFSRVNSERVSSGTPNNEQSPSSIGKIVASLGESQRMFTRGVKVSPKDFHGDGGGSEVCIVSTDRLLGDNVDPQINQPIVELLLRLGLVTQGSLLADRLPAFSFPAHGSASHGCMASTGLLLALFRSELSSLNSVCLRHIPHWYASLSQALSDDGAADSQLFRENILRLASKVLTSNGINVERDRPASNLNPSLLEAIEDSRVAYPKFSGQAGDRSTREIFGNDVGVVQSKGLRSEHDPSLFKPISHSRVTDSSLSSQFADSAASLIPADNLGAGLRVFGSVLDIDASVLESLVQTGDLNIVPSSDRRDGITSEIFRDQVVKVERRVFFGHVYNLETLTGWYFANDIITHNCRCTSVPVKPEWLELGLVNTEWSQKFREEGLSLLRSTGKEPNNGLAPFEKASGATEPPKPIAPEELISQPTSAPRSTTAKPTPQGDSPRKTATASGARRSPHEVLISKGEKAIGKRALDALDRALTNPELETLKADLKKLGDEYDALHAVDHRAAFPLGKQYEALEAKYLEAQLQVDRAALKIMSQIEDKLLDTGMGQAEAAALAAKANILKSAEIYESLIQADLTDFYQLTGGLGSDSIKYIANERDRGYANRGGVLELGKPLSNSEQRRVFFHEAGHHVEFESDRTYLALKSWIESRATGEAQSLKTLLPGSGYEDDEAALPDKFIDPYVGKLYKGSTEVLSMGLQHFTSAVEMLDLYKRDREHFLLTVGAIRPGTTKRTASTATDESTEAPQPGQRHLPLIDVGKAIVSTETAKVDKVLTAYDADDRLASDFAQLKKLEPEWDALVDELGDEAYETTFGKQYLDLYDRYEVRRSKYDDQAIDILEDLRNSLLADSGLTEKQAIALAKRVKISDDAIAVQGEDTIRARLAEFYQLSGGKGSGSLRSIIWEEGGAWADDGTGELAIGNRTDPMRQEMSFYHEMGHHIEFESKAYKEALVDWIRSRASGEMRPMSELLPGAGYEDDELAYPDEFADPYVGRVYEDDSTEALSVGIEHFASSDMMLNLYRRDPEHFFLIVGLLRAQI